MGGELTEVDSKYVSKAKEVVFERFPDMVNTEPDVSKRDVHAKGREGVNVHYVFTFRKGVSLQDGGRLVRVVRVTVDETGEVIRLTCSK